MVEAEEEVSSRYTAKLQKIGHSLGVILREDVLRDVNYYLETHAIVSTYKGKGVIEIVLVEEEKKD